jgi:methyl-accepting chemotaxis protein
MKLTLGKKLGLGFGVILALMVLSSTMTYLKASNIKQNEDRALDIRVPSVEAAKNLQRDLNMTQNKGRQTVLAGTDPTRREAAKKLFDGAWGAVEKDVAAIDELAPKWTLQAKPRPSGRRQEATPLASRGSGDCDGYCRGQRARRYRQGRY